MTYSDWIRGYVAKNPHVGGLCASATLEMVKAFPELKRVAGYATTALHYRVQHWWCVAPDGSIVDPTVRQFQGLVPEYEPWQPGMEVKVGRCMNCGDDIYRPVGSLDGSMHMCICSDECGRLFNEWQTGEINELRKRGGG